VPKSRLLWTTQMPANPKGPRLEFVRPFRINCWPTYLIIIPLIVAVTLLPIFFFAAFLSLFAAVLAIAGLRVWWLRAKLRGASVTRTQRQGGVINELGSIDTDKIQNQHTNTRNCESLCRQNHEPNL